MRTVIEMFVLNVLVICPPGSGKNTFIQNLADDLDLRHRRIKKAHGFGAINVDKDHLIHLYEGAPKEQQSLWEIQTEFTMAYVLVVDVTKPDTFAEARAIRDGFLKLAHGPAPYVIAANRFDAAGASILRLVRVPIHVYARGHVPGHI